MEADEKACPFCAETIKAAAIVCKHCGRDIPQAKTHEQLEMEKLGIVLEGERYRWRGNYFRNLSDAITYAKDAPPLLGYVEPAATAAKSKPFKWWLWLPVGGIAAFLVFGFAANSTPEGQEKSRQRRAIALCWETQGRKSLSQEAQRFAASACEQMEAEFRQRWGVNP